MDTNMFLHNEIGIVTRGVKALLSREAASLARTGWSPTVDDTEPAFICSWRADHDHLRHLAEAEYLDRKRDLMQIVEQARTSTPVEPPPPGAVGPAAREQAVHAARHRDLVDRAQRATQDLQVLDEHLANTINQIADHEESGEAIFRARLMEHHHFPERLRKMPGYSASREIPRQASAPREIAPGGSPPGTP